MGIPRKRGLLAAAVIVPVALFAAVYLIFFTSDSPDRLTLSTADGEGAEVAGDAEVPVEGRWEVVAADSEAGYRVREKLANLPAKSDAVGRTSAVTGGFVAEESDGGAVAGDVAFEVDLTGLKSDQDKRDNKIKEIGLETAKFPTAAFKSTEPVEVPEEVLDGKAGTTEVTGDLTIHGTTKRVTIPLDVQRTVGDGGVPVVEVVGSLTFPFTDFGMSPPNVGVLVAVDPDATLEFRLVMRKAGA